MESDQIELFPDGGIIFLFVPVTFEPFFFKKLIFAFPVIFFNTDSGGETAGKDRIEFPVNVRNIIFFCCFKEGLGCPECNLA